MTYLDDTGASPLVGPTLIAEGTTAAGKWARAPS
jgi:hypothetical protein